MVAYLRDSSSNALSKSSDPSFLAFALCFFCAFHSFFDVLPDGEEVGWVTGSGPAVAMAADDVVALLPS